MADAAASPDEDAASAPAPKSMGKRLIKLAGIAVLCLGALVGGLVASMGTGGLASLLGMGGDDTQMAADAHGDAPTADGHGAVSMADSGQGDVGDHASGKPSIVVTPFKEIIVNVGATTATGRQTTRFLKLNAALVYDESLPGGRHIEDRKLFLRDSFQDYLRQLNETDLQGSVGLVRLKAELLRRSRAIAGGAAPQEILIADLIVQ